jgi:hypothetical protein
LTARFLALVADGSTHFFADTIDLAVGKGLSTIAGRETVAVP